MSMLNWKDIIVEQRKGLKQEFFSTSPKLKNEYNEMCNNCTKIASELYQIEDIESKEYLRKKEDLEVQQNKLNQFVAKYDIKI